MGIDKKALEESLCRVMCAQISMVEKDEDLFLVDTPFSFPDGDPYQIYIKVLPAGLLRITDMGHTLMHLSYENDPDKFREGTRGRILEQIKAETEVGESDGEFFVDTSPEDMGKALFRLSHAITKINDLTFLARSRVESTFYEDVFDELRRIVGGDRVIKDYILPNIEKSGDYPIDYRIEGKQLPLYLFAIPSRDKAKLTTIILQWLLAQEHNFDSILIFADQAAIPKSDIARLSNVGGEMVASMDARDDLSRKILKKVA